MSIRTIDPSLTRPVALDIDTLERLVRAARLKGLVLSIKTNVSSPYRYLLHRTSEDAAPVAVVLSNDIGDVARYLGISDITVEPTWSTAGTRPTRVHEFDKHGESHLEIEGYVSLRPTDKEALAVAHALPRAADGTLDTRTEEFKDRVKALGIRTGEPMLYCKKDLMMCNGDALAAEARLLSPGRRLGML